MKTKGKAEKFSPPPEEGELSFDEALRVIVSVPKEVVDERMKRAKKKRQKRKSNNETAPD